MRTSDDYAKMTEKAIDKAGEAQESGNNHAVFLHMEAANCWANLSLSAAIAESVAAKVDAGKHGYL